MGHTSEPAQRLEPGHLLAGKYRIDRLLGRGAMGVVYAAQHELLHVPVAVKLMRPALGLDPLAVFRFLNEARNASRIQSDHVVRIFDVGVLDSGVPFIVMELLEGADLALVLRHRGPLPIAPTVDWLLEVVEALAHAHAIGIVHRDIKPSNLFLSRRHDGTDRIKVLDFGVSKTIAAPSTGGMTITGAVVGTPLYMAPEQLRGAKLVDSRADIWALGAVAYELLSGHVPFPGDNVVAVFAATCETTPTPPREFRPEIPAGLEAALLRCLQREPDARFANVGALGVDLAPYGTPSSVQTLARALRVSYSTDSRVASHGSSGSTSTVGETLPSAQVSGEPPAVKQSAPPWSSESGRPARSPTIGRFEVVARRVPLVRVGGVVVVVIAALGFELTRFHWPTAPAVASESSRPPVAIRQSAGELSAPPTAPATNPPSGPARTPAFGEDDEARPTNPPIRERPSGSAPAERLAPERRAGMTQASRDDAATLLASPFEGDDARSRPPAGTAPSGAASVEYPGTRAESPQSPDASPSSSTPNCNPPFYYDLARHKHYEPECP